jgi:hypothetical protein
MFAHQVRYDDVAVSTISDVAPGSAYWVAPSEAPLT